MRAAFFTLSLWAPFSRHFFCFDCISLSFVTFISMCHGLCWISKRLARLSFASLHNRSSSRLLVSLLRGHECSLTAPTVKYLDHHTPLLLCARIDFGELQNPQEAFTARRLWALNAPVKNHHYTPIFAWHPNLFWLLLFFFCFWIDSLMSKKKIKKNVRLQNWSIWILYRMEEQHRHQEKAKLMWINKKSDTKNAPFAWWSTGKLSGSKAMRCEQQTMTTNERASGQLKEEEVERGKKSGEYKINT